MKTRLGRGIHKLMEEDAMLRFFRDAQTKAFLIAGTGNNTLKSCRQTQEAVITQNILKAPKFPIGRPFAAKRTWQGRHKKQTGGHGQYGDCKD